MWETWVQSLGWEDSPGEGKGYPLQYSSLENSMDCIVHGVAKSQTWLSDFHFHFFTFRYHYWSWTIIFLSIHCCSVDKPCLTLCSLMDSSTPGPPSMRFSRQEYWSGLPFLSPGDLPDPGIKPTFPALADGFFNTEPSGKTKKKESR